MSDDEDFMLESGDEDADGFDFVRLICDHLYHTDMMTTSQEYESDEDGSDEDADLENMYYGAKQMKERDPSGAIKEFQKV